MRSTCKLSNDERRAAIIKAVRRVFAEKGFHGTTTRELANAAGVSEALLFKHFPNKEALFAAMLLSCCNEQDTGTMEQLNALEASASTLVILVHLLVSRMLGWRMEQDGEASLPGRLVLRSLTEDGEFARLFLQGLPSQWVQKVEECIQAAIRAGDAVAGPVSPRLQGWFTHHLAAMLAIHLLPARPVVDYGVSRDRLLDQTVWFTLRGMGLKDEAIKRHNPLKKTAK
jgi:AcrR family transcriptional regulator